jgi:hypothetical protein
LTCRTACGLNFWIFLIATILTLPKQIIVVYLGTKFNDDKEKESTTSKIVTNCVLAFGFLITLVAAWYIYHLMAKWRPIVLEERALKEENAFLAGDETPAPWIGDRPSSRTYVHIQGEPSPPKRAASPAFLQRNESSQSLNDYQPTYQASPETTQWHPYARPEYPRSAIEYAKPSQPTAFDTPRSNPQVLVSAPPQQTGDAYRPGGLASQRQPAQQYYSGSPRSPTGRHPSRDSTLEGEAPSSGYIVP